MPVRRVLPLVRDGRGWYAEGVAGSGSHDARPAGHDDVPFGALLRRLRQDAGLTQEELADGAGLSARAISSLERGERKHPYPHTARSLADALGLPDDERASLLAAVPGRGGATQAPMIAPSESNLPSPSTPLLGREEELREVGGFLGEVRLLTLTGIGGVGKTRLALESARASLAAGLFPDGVAFVSLAPLEDPALVIPNIARSLGVRETEGRSLEEVLRARLLNRRTLLVLDNFEHVLDAAPGVAGLMEACPEATILATSRAPLRVRGEQEYPVPPLRLPASTLSPEARSVLASPAGGLFVQRAKAASPAFEVTKENAADVAAICWRLAGLPLALELAAARIRFLDPAALLTRLDVALSAGWARDLPERQRTMRAALDWSHDLLDPEEMVLFRRLSVFAGGFSLGAAEAIGAVGEAEPGDALTLLGELAEQSLVTVERPHDQGGAPGIRHGMLEPVRQYAREKLEGSGEAVGVRGAHAAFFLALAEAAEPELRGPRQVEWLNRLEEEHGNLRAAASWFLEHGGARDAVGLGWSLWPFWWARGHHGEGHALMEAALASGDDLPARARARALWVAGTMLIRMGDVGRAAPLYEESLALFGRAGDEAGSARASAGAGLGALRGGDPARGARLMEEARRLHRTSGDAWSEAQTLVFLGMLPFAGEDHERAAGYFEQSLELARRIGDPLGTFAPTYSLAQARQALGDHAAAARLYAEALGLAEEIGNAANMAYCLRGLAECSGARGEAEKAARLYGAAAAFLEGVGLRLEALVVTGQDFHERYLSLARSRLDDRAWAAAWSEGREMGFERAVAYALGEDAAAPTVP